ncbi:MAG TPA: hypothetical protein VG167_01030 [Verrucomicrobiae bacterium]|nr:hypothetical protein [Verrucomicrobiae bacterium]
METYTNPADGTIWVENISPQAQLLNAAATAAGVQPMDASGPPSPGPGDTNAPPPSWHPCYYFRGLSAPGWAGEADTNAPLLWWSTRPYSPNSHYGWDWQSGTPILDGEIIWSLWPNQAMKYTTNWPYGVFTVVATNGSGVWTTNSRTLYMHAGRNAKRDILYWSPTLGLTNYELFNAQATNYEVPSIYSHQSTISNHVFVDFTVDQPLTFTNIPAPPAPGDPGWPTNIIVINPNPSTNGVINNPPYYPPDLWNPPFIVPPVYDIPPPETAMERWYEALSRWINNGCTGPFPPPPISMHGEGANPRISAPCGIPGTNYTLLVSQTVGSGAHWFVGATFAVGQNGIGNYVANINTNEWIKNLTTNLPGNIFLRILSPPITVSGL